MTLYGYLFMALGWVVIIALTAFCYKKILFED
jgi:hypothetical protein